MSFAEAEIRRGLDSGEFFPVFQPMVELRTGQLAGFEVLARWKPEGRETVLPGDFIPLAQKSGLIDRLTEVILSRAFACAALTESRLMLSFNLSPTQLLDRELPRRLEAAARAGRFPLDRLTVEITESALADDLARAAAVAQSLKALHCRLALDDFGTGYSSLTHLHALPFDELKVDQSFVHSMTQKRESREIVAAVIGLGQSLRLMTVAEGVETLEQAEILFWMGCDLAQGWYYGQPVAAEEIDGVLARGPWESLSAALSPQDGNALASLQGLPANRVSQLQAIYDGAPVGLAFIDRELRYRSLNRQLVQMNGLPAAAHLGRKVAEVIPHIFPRVEPFIRRALQGESISGIEITKPPGPDGRSQTLMVSYRPVLDAGGEVQGVSVAVMDVTERKRTEEALRESEDHFRHMMRLGPHVPWVLDAKGEVIEASPRWEEYTGQPLKEAMGNGWMRMLHPADRAHTRKAIRQTLESGVAIDVEYRVRKAGGGWTRVRSRGGPRFSETGEILCVYGVAEEIDGPQEATESEPAAAAEG